MINTKGEGEDDDGMRPNPAHNALHEVLDLAESKLESIAEALDEAHRIMSSGEAWTGKTTAATFLEDLGYRKDDLPRLAERLVEDIRDVLNSTPEEIPSP